MEFTAKYRPKRIEDMIGSTNIRHSLTTLLEKNRMPNSVILAGDNGIGKTSMAYSLAYNLICGCGEKDCPKCPPIEKQLWGRQRVGFTDVYEFDLGKDRDDRFVDSVLDTFKISGRKVIILDEIQNLSQMNMTKFLKTFENLGEDTYLIICTTELYKLNNGIISRCQSFELTPPSPTELAGYLESVCRTEGVRFERPAVYTLAKLKYRVRDALRTLETVIDVYGKVYSEDVRKYFGKGDSDLAIQYLKSCKEDSPYRILDLIQKVKEGEGLFKFTESLKETLLDTVYLKYNIKPDFLSDTQVSEVRAMLNKFTSEEITLILARFDRFGGRSNLDREIALVNLAFSISNGTLFKKVGVEEEVKVKKEDSKPKLKDGNTSKGEVKRLNKGFTFDSPSTLEGAKEDKLEGGNKRAIMDLADQLFGKGE